MSESSRVDRLTGYLLGRLSSEEEARLEEDYLGSHERFLEISAAEDDLVDDYAANRLSADDRRRFEERLLPQPEIRERVAFAQALALTSQAESRPSRSPRRAVALAAAAALAALALAGWMQWSLRRTRGELELAAAREESLRAEVAQHAERIAELGREITSPLAGIAPWALRPGRTRDAGAQPPSFEAPGGAWVRVRLPLERDAYPRYAAALRTADGETLLTVPAVRLHSKRLDVMIPAAVLRPGAYDVLLLGASAATDWEEADVYPLRVLSGSDPNSPKP